MKVLFDQGTPAPLRSYLVGHEVSTAYEIGWSELKNGELLAAAEAGFMYLSPPIKIFAISRMFPSEGFRSWCCPPQVGPN